MDTARREADADAVSLAAYERRRAELAEELPRVADATLRRLEQADFVGGELLEIGKRRRPEVGWCIRAGDNPPVGDAQSGGTSARWYLLAGGEILRDESFYGTYSGGRSSQSVVSIRSVAETQDVAVLEELRPAIEALPTVPALVSTPAYLARDAERVAHVSVPKVRLTPLVLHDMIAPAVVGFVAGCIVGFFATANHSAHGGLRHDWFDRTLLIGAVTAAVFALVRCGRELRRQARAAAAAREQNRQAGIARARAHAARAQR